MRSFISGSSSHIAPPPMQPLSLHQRSSPTSGVHDHDHQLQLGYPTAPVGTVGGRDATRRTVDDGQASNGHSVSQQQQQMVGYPTQKYQNQIHAHWYGQPTNTRLSQPSHPTYGYSSVSSAGPSYGQRAHAACAPTRNPSMYATPIPTMASQWTSGSSTQVQEQYYYPGPTTYSQPTQADQQPRCTSPTHATGTHQVHTPAASSKSGPGLRTSPMAPGPIPLNATVPPVTGPLSSPAGPKGGAAVPSVPASVVGSQVPHRDDSAQGQEQQYRSSDPAPYQRLEPMQPYPHQPYSSPMYATPADAVSLANAPSSHIPPQTNPTASGEKPNSGAGPSGSNVNTSGASGEPINQQIGPIRSNKTNRRQLSKPYKRPTSAPRKPLPITYERNLVRLQQRCKRQGADEGAIGLLGRIFANEVSLEALTRQVTDTEAEIKEFGIDNGKVYNALLGYLDEEDGVVPRHNCRLCHSEKTWKHPRDVLRHLRRDHFGLADICEQWYVFDHSLV